LLPPVQFFDRFDLTPSGVELVPNRGQKMAFGFNDTPDYREAGVPPQASDAAANGTVGGNLEAGAAQETGASDAFLDVSGDAALDATVRDAAAPDAAAPDAAARDAASE
jgi:hypothetical protein